MPVWGRGISRGRASLRPWKAQALAAWCVLAAVFPALAAVPPSSPRPASTARQAHILWCVGPITEPALTNVCARAGFEVFASDVEGEEGRNNLWRTLLDIRRKIAPDGLLVIWHTGPFRLPAQADAEALWWTQKPSGGWADPKDDVGVIATVLHMAAPPRGRVVVVEAEPLPTSAENRFDAARRAWMQSRVGSAAWMLWAVPPGGHAEGGGRMSLLGEAVIEAVPSLAAADASQTHPLLERIVRNVQIMSAAGQQPVLWSMEADPAAASGAGTAADSTEQALQVLRDLLKTKSSAQELGTAFMNAAMEFEQNKQIAVALPLAEEAIRHTPEISVRAQVGLIRARWQRRMGQWESARSSMQEVCGLLTQIRQPMSPLRIRASTELGELEEQAGQFVDAAAAYGLALDEWARGRPDMPREQIRFYTGLGRCNRTNGNLAFAERHLLEALKIMPDGSAEEAEQLVHAYRELAAIYRGRGSVDLALQSLDAGVAMAQKASLSAEVMVPLLSDASELLFRAGRYDEALKKSIMARELYERKKEPVPNGLLFAEARAQLKLGRLDETRRLMDACEQKKEIPRDAEWWILLGELAVVNSQPYAALAYFEKAIDILGNESTGVDRGRLSEVYIKVASLQFSRGNPSAALRSSEFAIRYMPSDRHEVDAGEIYRVAALCAEADRLYGKAADYAKRSMPADAAAAASDFRHTAQWAARAGKMCAAAHREADAIGCYNEARRLMLIQETLDPVLWMEIHDALAACLPPGDPEFRSVAMEALVLRERPVTRDLAGIAHLHLRLAQCAAARHDLGEVRFYLNQASKVLEFTEAAPGDRAVMNDLNKIISRLLSMPQAVGVPEDLQRYWSVQQSLGRGGSP